jgi:hypothetical protein
VTPAERRREYQREYHRKRALRKRDVPKRALMFRDITKTMLRVAQAELAEAEGSFGPLPERPKTREVCRYAERPCPWLSCKHHLYLDVTRGGSITFNFPDLEPEQLAESCSLDVADRGGVTLESVGELMNMTRERVRQIEDIAIRKIQESGLLKGWQP